MLAWFINRGERGERAIKMERERERERERNEKHSSGCAELDGGDEWEGGGL